MLSNKLKPLAAATGVSLLAAAGCSSSKSSGSSSAGGHTYTVGLLTDLTGLGASSSKTAPQGVIAGTVYASKQGYTIKYVVGDAQTSPARPLRISFHSSPFGTVRRL